MGGIDEMSSLRGTTDGALRTTQLNCEAVPGCDSNILHKRNSSVPSSNCQAVSALFKEADMELPEERGSDARNKK